VEKIPEKLRLLLEQKGIKNLDSLGNDADAWIEELSDEYTCFPAARDVLRSVGGLVSRVRCPGIDFSRTDFSLDPIPARGEGEFIANHEQFTGTKLYPIGFADQGTDYLVIGENGNCFWIGSDLERYDSYVTLIEGLLSGKRGESIRA
jgi:hypothetical protein